MPLARCCRCCCCCSNMGAMHSWISSCTAGWEYCNTWRKSCGPRATLLLWFPWVQEKSCSRVRDSLLGSMRVFALTVACGSAMAQKMGWKMNLLVRFSRCIAVADLWADACACDCDCAGTYLVAQLQEYLAPRLADAGGGPTVKYHDPSFMIRRCAWVPPWLGSSSPHVHVLRPANLLARRIVSTREFSPRMPSTVRWLASQTSQ